MKLPLIAAAAALMMMIIAPAPVQAQANILGLTNPIENACNRSERAGNNRALCRCIGRVARTHLTRSERRRAARFFGDPQLAQDIRMSRSPGDATFWRNYRAFGRAAEAECAG